jgi:hypothetical protein
VAKIASTTQGTKLCTSCASPLPALAKKCRFCGEFQEARPGGLRGVAEKHITLLITVVISFWVLLKLLAVSKFRPETAQALLQSAGATQVIMGVFLAGLATLLWSIAMLALQFWVLSTERTSPYHVAGVVLGVSGAVLITPWPFAVLYGASALILSGLALAIRRKRRQTPDGSEMPKGLRRWAILSIGFFLLLHAVGGQMWLPSERIDRAGQDDFIGYVVAHDGGWTTILQDQGRVVLRFPTVSITGLQLCELPPPKGALEFFDWQEPSALELLGGDVTRPPPCSTPES